MPAPILICDDDSAVAATLRLFFKSEGWNSEVVTSPAAALDALNRSQYALLISDMNFARDTTSGREGMDLIAEARRQQPELPIIAISGWGTVGIAVDTMRLGANDFIEKPWDNARLASIVRNLLQLRQSREKSARLAAENHILRADSRERDWVCSSDAMREVMAKVESVARTDVNILLTGENGTGKSQLAELIHRASHRGSASLISVNMGAIPDALFESEMFGHQKGAFTDAREERIGRFELADGGTLFLDEIGNLPISQQAKLLQAIETGQFERLGSSRRQHSSVRLITATNASLTAMVEEGTFRRDLYYRLNSIEIMLPPLRARQQDLALLADIELKRFSRRYHKPVRVLSPAAVQALHDYAWPGNVRELSHCLERATLLSKGGTIEREDLGLSLGPNSTAPPTGFDADSLSLEDAEQLLIRAALRRSQGNAIESARLLGLSRSAFYRRLQKYQL